MLKRFITISATLIPIITIVFMTIHGVNAAGDCSGGASGCSTVSNPLGSVNSVSDFLQLVFKVVMRIGMIVISVAIVFVGFQYVVAQGKPEALKKAHANFLYTIIGAALILGAWLITTILASTANSLSS